MQTLQTRLLVLVLGFYAMVVDSPKKVPNCTSQPQRACLHICVVRSGLLDRLSQWPWDECVIG